MTKVMLQAVGGSQPIAIKYKTMEQATIQEILEINEHPNADALELATILGWQVVIKKGQFKVGDKVVYVGLDSILPPHPEFEFLAKNKYRIKTAKLRGEMSYGIVFSMDTLIKVAIEQYRRDHLITLPVPVGHNFDHINIGDSVTEAMGVKKYEKPVPKCQDAKGGFPTSIIRKTDEERVQNIPHILDEIGDREIYITAKADGSSLTVYKENGELSVCSRNMMLEEPENIDSASNFWAASFKYGLDKLPNGYYVQAELIGPNIQGNPHGLDSLEIRVFNVGIIRRGNTQLVEGLDMMTEFCKEYNLPMAELIYRGKKNFETIDDLEKIANAVRYENGKIGEGVVIRYTEAEDDFKMQKPLSFKMISPKYALKHDE